MLPPLAPALPALPAADGGKKADYRSEAGDAPGREQSGAADYVNFGSTPHCGVDVGYDDLVVGARNDFELNATGLAYLDFSNLISLGIRNANFDVAGVEHEAPVFLAVVGDPTRFHSQSAFANFNGVVPDSRQSADKEAKGLKMTKASWSSGSTHSLLFICLL